MDKKNIRYIDNGMHMPRHLPQVKAVLFDWDNTLIEPKNLYGRVTKRVLNELHGDNPPADFKADRGRGSSISDYFRKWFTFVGDKNIEAQTERMMERFCGIAKQECKNGHKAELYEGSVPLIKWLVEHNIPVGIVSNSPHSLLCETLVPKMLGKELADNIVIVGALPSDHGKPELDSATRALHMLESKWKTGHHRDTRFKANNIYFVGDSLAHDVEISGKLGMTPVLVDHMDMDVFIEKAQKDQESIPKTQQRFIHMDDVGELHKMFEKLHARDAQQAIAI